jgi:hypothetical protein
MKQATRGLDFADARALLLVLSLAGAHPGASARADHVVPGSQVQVVDVGNIAPVDLRFVRQDTCLAIRGVARDDAAHADRLRVCVVPIGGAGSPRWLECARSVDLIETCDATIIGAAGISRSATHPSTCGDVYL